MIASENIHGLPLSMTPVPGSESDLHAVLHSVTLLLSKIIGCNCAALVLLNEDGQSARLYLLDLVCGASGIPTVRDVPIDDAALEALINGRKPRYIPDVTNEPATLRWLLQHTRIEPSSSAHVFPVASPQRRPGILVFITNSSESNSARNRELMASATVLISTFLDTALAFAAAESYKQNLARERDRLKLVLEINNHTIAHLDMDGLFRAASKSLHEFFDTALTGFWLFEHESNHLDLLTLDSPTALGFRENTTTAVLQEADIANMRARVATIFGPHEIGQLPAAVVKPLRDNGIVSLGCVPLVGSQGPLGIISLGSKDENAFSQDDLDLLSQIANQISLALDNALAYRRMTFSCRRLEDERDYLQSEFQSQYNFEDIVGQAPRSSTFSSRWLLSLPPIQQCS